MTGCDECDFHGPEMSTTIAAWRDLHRAAHALGRALAAPIEAKLSRLTLWCST